jgi:DNA-binding NtrC family response regulator
MAENNTSISPQERRMTILVVDDDESMRDILKSILDSAYHVLTVPDGASALSTLEERHVDIVLLDLCMPDMSGLEVLKKIKENRPHTVVIMITVVREVKSAVHAIQLGAFDYINKDFDYDEILALVGRAVDHLRSNRELSYLRETVAQSTQQDFIIGKTAKMQKIEELMRKAALVSSTVIITGESGTGKEMVARQIHKWSDRASEPFVAVNLASIPSELIEATLFGHEKGSFTGAHCQRCGKFELANDGTLFLDEVSELRFDLQAKLLRVIQDGLVERIGSTHTIPTNVRLVAASNTNLHNAVREGKFREDLFYRLHVLPIHLPPLRDRLDDIPQLIDLFTRRYCERFHRCIKGMPDDAINILMAYNWPGNIRELENLIERMVVLSDKEILTIHDIPLEYRFTSITSVKGHVRMSDVLKHAVEKYECALILQFLREENWHQGRCAERLGIHRKTLEYKIRKLNIQRDQI